MLFMHVYTKTLLLLKNNLRDCKRGFVGNRFYALREYSNFILRKVAHISKEVLQVLAE
jgi:hypothetical protein